MKHENLFPIKLLCFLCLFLTGCSVGSKYIPKDGQPTAQIIINVESDPAENNGRVFRAQLYPDNRCVADKKNSLGLLDLPKPKAQFKPAIINAGQPLMLGVSYIDMRFSENRECSYLANFTPQKNEVYFINFKVRRDALRCKLSIRDKQDHPISFESPTDCFMPKQANLPNPPEQGIGNIIIHRINVY